MISRLVGRVAPVLLLAYVLIGTGNLFLVPASAASALRPVPSPTDSPTPSPSAAPPTPAPSPSDSASPSPSPSLLPSPTPIARQATRVVIPRFAIDLPIVKRPDSETFPYCNVAETDTYYREPGEGGVTFVYAHARVGMFWPLLVASWSSSDDRLLGAAVRIYTDDDLVFTYRITEVHRHQVDWSLPDGLIGEALVLQTSETSRATGPKLMLVARLVTSGPATFKDAHPTPHPLVCS